jgi:two-component system, sensor histidine kinase PdtaS
MDARVRECRNLTPDDLALLDRISAGLAITADVSRADLLLCCLLPSGRALVTDHAMPRSISSLYREPATGRVYTAEEAPLLLRALQQGRGGRTQQEILSRGAPVLQDVHPIFNRDERVIAALLVETNMIAHERQQRRDRSFRHALYGLQEMCMRGELAGAENLSRFSVYDGIYLVDRRQMVIYLSGVAANLFRSIRLAVDFQNQTLAELEEADQRLVAEVLRTGVCMEERSESEDGRVWVRKALPVRLSLPVRVGIMLDISAWFAGALRSRFPRSAIFRRRERNTVDAVMVLMHNATEAVQKQRELNVKSALIQEVHHRVKNNLQTIAAILRIQARRSTNDEARQHLMDAVNRILGMSVIHEFLSEDEHRPINIRDVCQRIAQQVEQVAGNPDQVIEIQLHGPNIRLPASQATPVAMVINELMLNALEHGLAGREGVVTIELNDLGDSVEIAIANSGSPLPANFDLTQSRSLGLQIVHTLVNDDLKGKVRLESIEQPVTAEPVTEDLATADLATADLACGAVEPGQTGEGKAAQTHAPDGPATQPPGAANPITGVRAVVSFPKRSLRVDEQLSSSV